MICSESTCVFTLESFCVHISAKGTTAPALTGLSPRLYVTASCMLVMLCIVGDRPPLLGVTVVVCVCVYVCVRRWAVNPLFVIPSLRVLSHSLPSSGLWRSCASEWDCCVHLCPNELSQRGNASLFWNDVSDRSRCKSSLSVVFDLDYIVIYTLLHTQIISCFLCQKKSFSFQNTTRKGPENGAAHWSKRTLRRMCVCSDGTCVWSRSKQAEC